MNLRRIIAVGCGVVLLLLVLAVLIPFTNTGTKWLVESLDGLGGMEFSYAGGSLMDELQLARVLVPTETVIVDVRDGRVVLDPGCLVRGRLCLQYLRVASVDVEVLLDEEEDEEDEEYLLWPLPFVISSNDVAIAQVRVHWEGAEILSNEVAGAAYLYGTLIEVSAAQAHRTRLVITAGDDEQSAEALVLPDVDLPVTIALDSIALYDSSWDIYGLYNHYDVLQFSGQWLNTELQIRDGYVTNALWGRLDISGDVDFVHPYQLDLTGRFEARQPPWWRGLHGVSGELQVAGDLAGLAVQGTLCNAALPLQLSGELDLVSPDWPLALQASGDCGDNSDPIMLAQLPGLPEVPKISVSPDWQLSVDGDLEQQSVQILMSVQEADYGLVEVRAQALHGAGTLLLEEVLVTRDQFDQSLKASGTVHYGEQLDWDLLLDVNDLALPVQFDPLSGYLDGSMRARGGVSGEHWSVLLSQLALQGEINALPAHVTGDLAVDQALNLDGSDVNVALNGADLWLVDRDGVLPRAGLTVADFAQWADGASGSLQLDLYWDRDRHRLTLEGSTVGARLGPLWLNEARLSGWHSYREGGEFKLAAVAEQLRVGEQWTENAELLFQGTSEKHRLTLATQGDMGTSIILDGRLVDGDWEGILQPVQLAFSDGEVQLEQPVAVDYLESVQQVTLADHCWQVEALEVCLVDTRLGESGSIKFDLDGDLAAFYSFLPNRFRANAALSAQVDARWSELEMQSLEASIEIGEGRVREQLLGGEYAEYAWDGVVLTYTGSHAEGRLLGSLRQNQADKLSLDVTIPAAMDGPLSGEFHVESLQLNAFNAFIEELSHLSGEVSGDLQFAGRMRKPEIRGELMLRDGAVAVASTPNRLQDVNLTARFLGVEAELNGEVALGGGTSQLQGGLDWLSSPRLSLAMSGGPKNLLFPVETVVTVSEDLLLDITRERISLTGSVDIPSGDFVLGQLPPSAVEVSEDVLLFDHTGQQLAEASQAPVEIDIAINVADQFAVSTSGIAGRLGGQLRVQRAAGKQLQVLGNVKIIEGRLELLGPRFDVKRGQLSFVGVPDNPNLNVVLERVITEEQVTVGIRVTGNVDNPKLDFYSRPALPEKEVMAYVVGGRGIDRTGDADSMALALAMTSGLMQSKGIMKGVSLGVEGRDRKARAAIGGYISERIYLSYGVGLYHPINTLTVRMDLIRNLWVEMVSGFESSADLYYAWSRP